MKLAIVHDWICEIGGAERVLIELHKLWPEAPIYTLLYDSAAIRRWLPNATIIASPLQKLWFRHHYYPSLAPLMPSAIESFDLSDYDTVLSNSVSFAKGIVIRPRTRHLCYCYSPTRMLWDRAPSYERKGLVSRLYRHVVRQWDFSAAQRPDQMLAISQTAADRIEKFYRRNAIVIPPPTREILSESLGVKNGNYLFVGRLVPHKNLETLINAFVKLKRPLMIVGDGPLKKKLQVVSSKLQANIQFMGILSDEELDKLYFTARAVIIPNEEDWGLTAAEAMAHGTPVLALRSGGATETVVEGVTGEFFNDAIPEAIADCVHRFENSRDRYNSRTLMTHASQWSSEKFATRMRTIIEK